MVEKLLELIKKENLNVNINNLHLNWADSNAFALFLYQVILFDKETNKTNYKLFEVIVYLRTVGIGLFLDNKFGFLIKPFIGKNPDEGFSWEGEEEYEKEKMYLLPYYKELKNILYQTRVLIENK